MYQSTFKREGFIIHPLEKTLKWDEVWSYLASQAIYIGIWNQNEIDGVSANAGFMIL